MAFMYSSKLSLPVRVRSQRSHPWWGGGATLGCCRNTRSRDWCCFHAKSANLTWIARLNTWLIQGKPIKKRSGLGGVACLLNVIVHEMREACEPSPSLLTPASVRGEEVDLLSRVCPCRRNDGCIWTITATMRITSTMDLLKSREKIIIIFIRKMPNKSICHTKTAANFIAT